MSRVKPLHLKSGTRIGSYRIVRPIGRGWEGEVYAVQEVPTEAPRVMKIVRQDPAIPVRDRLAAAWYFEQLSGTGSVARYYHMGQWFFDDDEGVFYYVFEYLPGLNLHTWLRRKRHRLTAAQALDLVVRVADCISNVHAFGYGVGDFETGENIIVLDSGLLKVCDCNPGVADRPNARFREDLSELRTLARDIFARHRRNRIFTLVDAAIKDYLGRSNSRHNMAALRSRLVSVGQRNLS